MITGYTYNQEEMSWINYNDKVNILDLLSAEYGGIPDSDMGYFFCKKDECDIFYELRFKNMPIGFATYDVIDDVHYILTSFYVKSEEYLSIAFMNQLDYHNRKNHICSIQEPSRKLIEVLVKNNLASKQNESLVISVINFNLDVNTLKSTTDSYINRQDKLYLTNLYDLDMCMSISLNIFDTNNYTCYYTQLDENDRNPKNIKNREHLDKSYTDNLVSYICEYDDIIEQRLFILRWIMHNKLSADEDLTDTLVLIKTFLDKLIDKHQITFSKAEKIQQQIINELEKEDVFTESVPLRLEYLSKNYAEENLISVEACPYCNDELDQTQIYCTTCGYVYMDIEESQIDEYNIDELIYYHVFIKNQEYKYSLKNNIEKKNEHDRKYLETISANHALYNIRSNQYHKELYEQLKEYFDVKDFKLKEFLENEEYISYSLNKQIWQEIAHTYKIPQLKAILKQFNQKTSGKKQELIDRITENVPLESLKRGTPHITIQGQKYLDDNILIMLFDEYLDDFIYEEFISYCHENPKEPYQQIISFMEEHEEYAIYKKNHFQLTAALSTQAVLYNQKNDYNKVLNFILKIFIIKLNMIYVKKEFIEYLIPLDNPTAANLHYLNQMLSTKKIKKTFKEIYKTFNKDFLTVPYEEALEILSQVLIGANLNRLNTIIKNTYYSDKEIIKPPEIKKDKTRTVSLDDFF